MNEHSPLLFLLSRAAILLLLRLVGLFSGTAGPLFREDKSIVLK